MKSLVSLFLRVSRQIISTVWRWAWAEPCAARGPWWTIALWFAVGSAVALALHSTLAFGVYLVATWVMGTQKPKNPARPTFRRRR